MPAYFSQNARRKKCIHKKNSNLNSVWKCLILSHLSHNRMNRKQTKKNTHKIYQINCIRITKLCTWNNNKRLNKFIFYSGDANLSGPAVDYRTNWRCNINTHDTWWYGTYIMAFLFTNAYLCYKSAYDMFSRPLYCVHTNAHSHTIWHIVSFNSWGFVLSNIPFVERQLNSFLAFDFALDCNKWKIQSFTKIFFIQFIFLDFTQLRLKVILKFKIYIGNELRWFSVHFH